MSTAMFSVAPKELLERIADDWQRAASERRKGLPPMPALLTSF